MEMLFASLKLMSSIFAIPQCFRPRNKQKKEEKEKTLNFELNKRTKTPKNTLSYDSNTKTMCIFLFIMECAADSFWLIEITCDDMQIMSFNLLEWHFVVASVFLLFTFQLHYSNFQRYQQQNKILFTSYT